MLLASTVGHARVIESLVAAVAADTVHHALLFAGPDGVGKRRVALSFIALVGCTGDAPRDAAGRRLDGCGSCRWCRHIHAYATGANAQPPPDLIVLAPEGTSRAVKIEPVRELLRVVPFPPIEAAYRYVLIDPAEALTVEAGNALLKTLEEPPSRTRFILVSSQPDALLITIRSRCQRVGFGRLREAEVSSALLNLGTAEGADVARVAPLSDGSVGAALRLIEDPVMQKRDELLARLVAASGSAGAAFELAATFLEDKSALPTVFEVLRRVFRDALLVRESAAATMGLSHPHLLESVVRPLAERFGTEALLHRIALVDETERGILRRNINPQLSLERLLAAITAPPGREGASLGLVP
ncbi:MAG: DNA polymerase III subunit delta' C-terminal domain-containing protein [Myxococcota bacterium]